MAKQAQKRGRRRGHAGWSIPMAMAQAPSLTAARYQPAGPDLIPSHVIAGGRHENRMALVVILGK